MWEDGCYIKAQSNGSFTIFIMDKQDETLVEKMIEERMAQGGLETPCGSRRLFRLMVALVATMGLFIVVLITAFILFYLSVTPSCNKVGKKHLHDKNAVL